MEHTFPSESFQRENRTTFSEVSFILEIFQWNELKTCVPFTSQTEFPEFLGKWKTPKLTTGLRHDLRLSKRFKTCVKALPNDKCWAIQHVGWTNILSFGHRVWWPLDMLDDVGTCLMQYQTFDRTSCNISCVLMLDAWNFVRLAPVSTTCCMRVRALWLQIQSLT